MKTKSELTEPQVRVLRKSLHWPFQPEKDGQLSTADMLPATREALLTKGYVAEDYSLRDVQARLEYEARLQTYVTKAQELIGHDWHAALDWLEYARGCEAVLQDRCLRLTEKAITLCREMDTPEGQ